MPICSYFISQNHSQYQHHISKHKGALTSHKIVYYSTMFEISPVPFGHTPPGRFVVSPGVLWIRQIETHSVLESLYVIGKYPSILGWEWNNSSRNYADPPKRKKKVDAGELLASRGLPPRNSEFVKKGTGWGIMFKYGRYSMSSLTCF